MSGQKNYFGKGDIRPSFPGSKSPADVANPLSRAKDSLKSAESSASANSTNNTSPRSLESVPSLYAKSTPISPKSAKKAKLLKGLLKSSPVLAVVAVLVVSLFLIFGSSSILGPHIEALFTESTNTDYTAYNLRTNELTTEILAGKLEMPDTLKSRLEKEGITVNSDQTLNYKDTHITATNFDSVYNSNAGFREAITYARRGRIATFFDDTANKFYEKLGMTRDVFHEYNTTGDAKKDESSYSTLLTNYFNNEAGATIDTAERHIVESEDGETTTEIRSTGASVTADKPDSTSAEERAREYLDSVGKKVSSTTPACAALEIGYMISAAVSANNNYNAAHEYMTKMESISKAKYGDSDSSAINSVLNWLTKVDTATVYNARTGEKTEVTGSPLESEGMRMVLGGLTADRSNTHKYSLERSFESTDISLANNGLVATACNVERAGGIVVSIASQAIPGSSLIRATIGILLQTTLAGGVQIIASSILGLLVPTIAETMFTNPFTNAIGIAGGEAFSMGAANANMLAAQQNSGATGASKEQALAYNQANNVTIAQQAEIDRKNHSAFDASNKNTFLGSITSSLIPLATTRNTAVSAVSTLSSITNSSLASISSAFATGENTTYSTNFGDYCDKLSEIGGAGNIYCHMITTHDLSVIDIPEDDPAYRNVISQSVDIVDGKEVIRDNSPLADFITFHMNRYSMPGIYDANIAYACEHREGGIPFLTDIVEMVKSIGSDYCKSVADGSRYINSSDNPNWDTEKYHQLYVLSARAKSNLGLTTDNPVLAYESHYEKTHPLDNSRSGYLARISGLTKEDAETVLYIADYYQALASYHPETAYNFSGASAEQQLSVTMNRDKHFAKEQPSSILNYTSVSDYTLKKEDYIS